MTAGVTPMEPDPEPEAESAVPSRLALLDPAEIKANPENPRDHFPDGPLDALAASIDKAGVLVPVSVYEDPVEGQAPYVLIDGERRWRMSVRLGRTEIPALVMPKPDLAENLKTMFNIHMVREDWDDMPTARAVAKLSERTGVTDVDELAELTGLKTEQLNRLLFANTLPADYQDLIDTNQIPLNFFFELKRNVLDLLASDRPAIHARIGEQRLIESFVGKRLAGAIPNVVELRKVRPIIKTAMAEAGPDGTSDLDQAIYNLIENPATTIQETYEETVEIVVELEKFERQAGLVVRRLDRLLAKEMEPEEAVSLRRAVRTLVAALTERVPGE